MNKGGVHSGGGENPGEDSPKTKVKEVFRGEANEHNQIIVFCKCSWIKKAYRVMSMFKFTTAMRAYIIHTHTHDYLTPTFF